MWNVCVARKAPLVASDSSSSGGSDSEEEEEEEKAGVVTETLSTGSGQETGKLTMDAKHEKAVFPRYERKWLAGCGWVPWHSHKGGGQAKSATGPWTANGSLMGVWPLLAFERKDVPVPRWVGRESFRGGVEFHCFQKGEIVEALPGGD